MSPSPATLKIVALQKLLRNLALLMFGIAACARTLPVEPQPQAQPLPPTSDASVEEASIAVAPEPWSPPRPDGPHEELSLDAGRPIFYAMPRRDRPFRLIGHLHGMCGAPSYACGKWIGAGTDLGIMICPTGNARCGDSPVGPPSWEAPTWMELVKTMDDDLEASIKKVSTKQKNAVNREGAILTGYSRGAYAAPFLAKAHPNRWPYMILIEANVPLTLQSLKASGVKAVAFVGGEQGDQIAGMRKTITELEAEHYPIKLFPMKKTGHLYSEDMEYVMHEALMFVTAN